MQRQGSGGTDVGFDCIGGSAADDIYAGGQIFNCTGTCPALLLHSTGDGNWTTVPTPPTESGKGLAVKAIGALSKNNNYLAVQGGSKDIYHSTDGMTWTPEDLTLANLDSFAIFGATDLFAASNSGTVFHSIGNGSWQIADNLPSCGDAFLFGTSASNLYTVCDSISNHEGSFLRFSGAGSFVPQTIDDGDFNDVAVAMSGSGAFDLYGAFIFAIKHSSGDGHWKSEILPSGIGEIEALWVAPDGQAFAGTHDEILHKR